MGRTCTICAHPERRAIEEAVAAYTPYRHISERYDISPSAISRHVRTHVAEELMAILRERIDEQRERELAASFGPEFAEWMRAEEARFAELVQHLGEGLGELELEEEGASE